MDFSTIDWAAVVQAVLALISAIFGLKLYAEKTGTRIPLVSKPTPAEQQLKLLAKQDALSEKLGMSAKERHERMIRGVEAMKPKQSETSSTS